MSNDQFLAARLLSGRDEPSILEQEAMLASVLRATATRRRSARLSMLRLVPWRLVTTGALTVAAVAVLSVAAHWLEPPEFSARGSGVHAGPNFSVSCDDGPCRPNARLVFELRTVTGELHFSAFARRQDGTVLWYFPGPAAPTSIRVSVAGLNPVIPWAILLGPEHTPGRYEVYGIFSPSPLTKEQIRSFIETEPAGRSAAVAIVQRTFDVE